MSRIGNECDIWDLGCFSNNEIIISTKKFLFCEDTLKGYKLKKEKKVKIKQNKKFVIKHFYIDNFSFIVNKNDVEELEINPLIDYCMRYNTMLSKTFKNIPKIEKMYEDLYENEQKTLESLGKILCIK